MIDWLVKILAPIITTVIMNLLSKWEADEVFRANVQDAAQKAKTAVTPEERHDARIAIQKLIAG